MTNWSRTLPRAGSRSVTARNSACSIRLANRIGGERQQFRLARIAPERHRLHEAARAVPAVRKVDAHRIAGIGELRHAHAPVHQPQDFFAPEVVRGLGAHIAPRADLRQAAPALAQRLDLLAENPLDLGVQIAGQQPLAGRELHGVRKCLVEFFENRRGIGPGPGQLAVELRGQAQQQLLVGRGMQAPQARKIGGLFEPPLAHAPRGGIEQQDADVHPLIADEIGLVTHHVIRAGLQGFFRHVAPSSLGNGSRPELRAAKISSRTRLRRA